MSRITTADVFDAVDEVVQTWPTRTNQLCQHYQYDDNGVAEPSCIAGEVFDLLGLRYYAIHNDEADLVAIEAGLSKTAQQYLLALQKCADNHRTPAGTADAYLQTEPTLNWSEVKKRVDNEWGLKRSRKGN